MSLTSWSSLTGFGPEGSYMLNGSEELKYSRIFFFNMQSSCSVSNALKEVLATSDNVWWTAFNWRSAFCSWSTTRLYKLSRASSNWSSERFPGAKRRNPKSDNWTLIGERFGWLLTGKSKIKACIKAGCAFEVNYLWSTPNSSTCACKFRSPIPLRTLFQPQGILVGSDLRRFCFYAKLTPSPKEGNPSKQNLWQGATSSNILLTLATFLISSGPPYDIILHQV